MTTRTKLCGWFHLTLLLVLCSGCATSHVSVLGYIANGVDFVPRSAAWTTNGAIVVEMQLVQRDLGIPAIIHRDLGRRYVLFKDNTVKSLDAQFCRQHQVYTWYDLSGHYRINFPIWGFIITSNTTDVCQTPEWYLYPPDCTSVIKDATLPPGFTIDPSSTVPFHNEYDSFKYAELRAIPIVAFPDRYSDYERNPRRYCWASEGYQLKGDEQQARWGRFVRYPLYIPAVIFDVVTCPFQAFHDACVWADGMSALGGY